MGLNIDSASTNELPTSEPQELVSISILRLKLGMGGMGGMGISRLSTSFNPQVG
jgi:hypothetical protein